MDVRQNQDNGETYSAEVKYSSTYGSLVAKAFACSCSPPDRPKQEPHSLDSRQEVLVCCRQIHWKFQPDIT